MVGGATTRQFEIVRSLDDGCPRQALIRIAQFTWVRFVKNIVLLLEWTLSCVRTGKQSNSPYIHVAVALVDLTSRPVSMSQINSCPRSRRDLATLAAYELLRRSLLDSWFRALCFTKKSNMHALGLDWCVMQPIWRYHP